MTHLCGCDKVEEECFRLVFIEMEEWLLKPVYLKKPPVSPSGWLTDLLPLPVHTCILGSIPLLEPTAGDSTCAQFKNPENILNVFVVSNPHTSEQKSCVFWLHHTCLISLIISLLLILHPLYDYKPCNCFHSMLLLLPPCILYPHSRKWLEESGQRAGGTFDSIN